MTGQAPDRMPNRSKDGEKTGTAAPAPAAAAPAASAAKAAAAAPAAEAAPQVVGRFAPSPSGPLHLGNLFSFLLAWLSARSAGGRVVLRIEDLDPQRTHRAFAEEAMEDLRFLGLDWDEGPRVGGPHGPYYQSERTLLYERCLQKLQGMGLVYPCFCSRAQLHAAGAPHAGEEWVYPGTCRGLTAAEAAEKSKSRPPALRLRLPDEAVTVADGHYGPFTQRLQSECGDFILRRSDGVFAYQLAVVADDAAMGVTQVVRGRDLLASAPRQAWLHRLLGAAPPRFFHLPLLLAADGRRLSKRDEDLGLGALRARGASGPQLVGLLGWLAGLLDRPQPVTPQELLPLFDWDKLPRTDIRLPQGWQQLPGCGG